VAVRLCRAGTGFSCVLSDRALEEFSAIFFCFESGSVMSDFWTVASSRSEVFRGRFNALVHDWTQAGDSPRDNE
jgi:hypothetical protein